MHRLCISRIVFGAGVVRPSRLCRLGSCAPLRNGFDPAVIQPSQHTYASLTLISGPGVIMRKEFQPRAIVFYPICTPLHWTACRLFRSSYRNVITQAPKAASTALRGACRPCMLLSHVALLHGAP